MTAVLLTFAVSGPARRGPVPFVVHTPYHAAPDEALERRAVGRDPFPPGAGAVDARRAGRGGSGSGGEGGASRPDPLGASDRRVGVRGERRPPALGRRDGGPPPRRFLVHVA